MLPAPQPTELKTPLTDLRDAILRCDEPAAIRAVRTLICIRRSAAISLKPLRLN